MEESRYRTYPKKRYGQHFLVDGNVIRKIVSLARVGKDEDVIEVGPGLGALTAALLDAGAHVVAVEVDRLLCERLEERFQGVENLELICEDALKVSFVELKRKRNGSRFKVVSNLPYNISGPILVKFLEEREAFTELFLMLQKEVALRLVADPGTKDYGVLSVLARAYADSRCEFNVSPGCFRPKPRVDSTVVSLRVLDRPRVPPDLERYFKRVLRCAFGRRRKTLLNALRALGADATAVERALARAGIDPKRRGETLGVEEYIDLTRSLLESGAFR